MGQEAKTNSVSASIYVSFNVAHMGKDRKQYKIGDQFECIYGKEWVEAGNVEIFPWFSWENTDAEKSCGAGRKDKIHTCMEAFCYRQAITLCTGKGTGECYAVVFF